MPREERRYLASAGEEAKNYQAQGFTDCITKPIKVDEIKSCLKKWIKDDYRMSYEEYMRIQNES